LFKFDASSGGILIIVALGFLLLSTVKSVFARWVVLAAVLISILGLSMALPVSYRWTVLSTLLGFGVTYIFFSGSNYNDIVTFNGEIAEQISRARRAVFGILIGKPTFDRFYDITLKQIVAAGLLHAGTSVVSTNGAWPASGVITADGCIEVNGTAYVTPSAAAEAVKDGPANGWDFWAVNDPTGRITLATFRTRYLDGPSNTAVQRNSN
jgi:hypothetical protein